MQWTGTIPGGATPRWFTFRWPATWHVIWTVMPTTVKNGAPELGFDVQIEARMPGTYVLDHRAQPDGTARRL